ncbi:SMI1/KNR4 family protein [Actinoplanes flavus]|uniref:SMI1/KNR4 family protein n=1 Tax=Actinoplanes flavus TaxID=2820290 RepID=A0ABS3UFH6_9ACTN|nr:SMI1/KNR4 family protein [Actinoplanes flavus]MBO3737498.1 SMI1/KNR4 family protein [Actinoplanes flavus]
MNNTALRQPELWRPLVSALRGGAPAGTRQIEFRGTVHPGSYGGSILDDGESRHGGRSVMDALEPLTALVDGRGVALRALVTAAGDAEVDIVAGACPVSFGMGSAILETVLLVDRADPEPYRRAPVRHDGVTTSPNADPEAVRALVQRLLPGAPAASPAALAAAESSLGAALPADVRALYLSAGAGDLVLPADPDLFYGMSIIALDDAAAREYLEPRSRYGSWSDGAIEVVAPDPAERVQPLAASPAWFAVGDDFGGNLLVVDLEPGPRGHVGQVLYVDHEIPAGARWLAPSLTELLTGRPSEPADPSSEDGLLVRVGPRGRTVADVRPGAEVVVVSAAPEPTDLSGLAGHETMRTLVVSHSATVTNLDVVTTLPSLEYLELGTTSWRQLLRADRVPPTLLAAGMQGRADWDTTVEVVDALLALWGRPRLDVTRVRLPSAG